MDGRWSSLQNGFAKLSGIFAPWVTGLIVQINGSSRLAFVITGGVALAGAFFWGLLVQRVEPVHWDAPNCMAGATPKGGCRGRAFFCRLNRNTHWARELCRQVHKTIRPRR